jgi:hypothetical protein
MTQKNQTNSVLPRGLIKNPIYEHQKSSTWANSK